MADNEAIARSFFVDLCNGRRLDLAPQLLAPNHRYHDPNAPAEDGPDGMVAALSRRPRPGVQPTTGNTSRPRPRPRLFA